MRTQLQIVAAALVISWLIPMAAWPTEDCQCEHRGPEAAGRSYAVNYRDLVLANCIARAYKTDPDASMDAGSSASALLEWTAFNMDDASRPMVDIIKSALVNDGTIEGSGKLPKDVRSSFSRCMDLYHGPGLAEQVRRYVGWPERTARDDARAHGLGP